MVVENRTIDNDTRKDLVNYAISLLIDEQYQELYENVKPIPIIHLQGSSCTKLVLNLDVRQGWVAPNKARLRTKLKIT